MEKRNGIGDQKSTGVRRIDPWPSDVVVSEFDEKNMYVCIYSVEKIGKFDWIIPTFKEDGKRSVLRLTKTGD